MKTVIIPSCGNAALIEKCGLVGDLWPGETVNYIFLDIRPVPDNYNDLITISRDGRNCGSFGDEFCKAVIHFSGAGKNRITSIDHFYGDSVAMFRNYLEFRNADVVVFDQEDWTCNPHFRQQDIYKMIMRCGAEVVYMNPRQDNSNALPQRVIRINKNILRKVTGNDQSDNHYENAGAGVLRNQHRTTTGPVTGIATGAVNGLPNANTATVSDDHNTKSQYKSVDEMLYELQTTVSGDEILIRQMSSLNRYFLKQAAVQKMLSDSKRDLLWIRK